MTRLLPPPPLTDSGAVWSAIVIAEGIVWGSLGGCVACDRTCWTWWSPAPPSGYVALHPVCVNHLRDLWYQAMEDGGASADDTPVPDVGRPSGAYARRRRTAAPQQTVARSTAVALAARMGIDLPQEFVPGPFWKPGFTAAEPWVTLAESAVGQVHTPFGRRRDRAVECLKLLRASRMVLHSVAVVGAVVLGPDGSRLEGWGEEPRAGSERWERITRLSEWRGCAGCGEPRWPGSWVTVRGGRCRGCTEPEELADPRPWPEDPTFPGLTTAPYWLGGPKPRKAQKISREAS